jgi:transcriptional regulator with GAF, ATPase, and Fis domain
VPDAGRIRLGGIELVVPGPARPQPVALWPEPHFGPLVGPSPAMRELFAQLARVAGSEATVLVQGESGTGKEMVARAIHDASPRARNPFVIVDCAALPENLIEAELFGHVRGAFTGAGEGRAGAIEAAAGGTVFLDEIGELPLAMQPKLLRVLESRQVRRLGETQQHPVDVRFISATNRDLRRMVNEREFREDLYFRLAVLPIVVPPLRDRPEDILALVQHFVPEQRRDLIGPELIRKLLDRRWSGNVRELRNFVERALTFGAAEALAMSAAPASGEGGARADDVADRAHLPYREARERALDDFERGYVAQLLARHNYEVAAAAQAAGVNRAYLYRLARKHRL